MAEQKEEEKTEKKRKSPLAYLTDRVMIGGMITVNIVILQALISLQKLDGYLHNSAIAISVALPFLVSALLLHDIPIFFGTENKKASQDIGTKIISSIKGIINILLMLAGTIATLIAVGNALYHISPDAGATFVEASIVLYVLLAFYSILVEMPRSKGK